MEQGEAGFSDSGWSSRALAPTDALRSWHSWASATLAPMQIEVADKNRFAAHWRSYQIGPLRLVAFEATSQRVVHTPAHREAAFQLLFCSRTPIAIRIGTEAFRVDPGEFALLDNAQPYEVSVDDDHEAIDLILPRPWLERWVPDHHRCTGRAFSAGAKWGLPLGSFVAAMAGGLEDAALPRTMIAEQIGPLLALALGNQPTSTSRHRAKTLQRVYALIEQRYAEPGLDPGLAAQAVGISRRHLHTLLAEAGTTFLAALARVRLDRAAELLSNRRFADHQIAEIAWRCGYLDPSYFARVFRRHAGLGPREWRNARLQRSIGEGVACVEGHHGKDV